MMKLTGIGVPIAVGLVVAFGLYLFGLGLRNVTRAVASSRWPRAAGKVVRADARERHDVDRKTGDGAWRTPTGSRFPAPGRVRQADIVSYYCRYNLLVFSFIRRGLRLHLSPRRGYSY